MRKQALRRNKGRFTEGKLVEAVYRNIGAASMCWSEVPTGKFDDIRASELAKEIVEAAKNYARNA